MARYECERCHAACFTTDPPHLCADIRKRHERQAKAVELVVAILEPRVYMRVVPSDRSEYEGVALAIIEALSGRDLGT